jgi:DNA repair protein RadC
MRYDIVSERQARYKCKITNPSDAFEILKRYGMKKQEHFFGIILDGSHTVIKLQIISIGLVNRTIVHPREVFKPVLLKSGTSIIIAHNHPSGNLEPSPEDIDITKRLKEAGDILGIAVLDHIIFSKNGFFSFKETGRILT